MTVRRSHSRRGGENEFMLKELVYLDDNQITDVLCRKRDLNTDFRVENPSALLAEGLARGTQFLHIIVEDAPDQGVIR